MAVQTSDRDIVEAVNYAEFPYPGIPSTVDGSGAMFDIGFQSLSRMLMSGMDIKVLILDSQVYSNTGGQTSTASFTGQDAKMAAVGRAEPGKREHRKELAEILMMHPDVFVAQTTAAHLNHFYKAVLAANEYPGPAVVICYATCQPEHGVPDDRSLVQAKLAVESRASIAGTGRPEIAVMWRRWQ